MSRLTAHLNLSLFLLVVLLYGCENSPSTTEGTAPVSLPNVVLIVADDLGWADLGSYGNPFYETPRLDALARNGVRFTQAYAACHVCSPTRASLLTGRYPARVGLTNYLFGTKTVADSPVAPASFTDHLPLAEFTLAEGLGQRGYSTGLMGKWHLGENTRFGESDPTQQGFDEAVGWDYGLLPIGDSYEWFRIGDSTNSFRLPYLTEMITERAVDYIDRHRDSTFFLAVTHYAVHLPLQGRADLVEHYRQKENPRPGDFHPIYAAMLTELDESVGRIVTALKDNGVYDNTLIVFVSDNGGLAVGEAGDKPTVNDPLRSGKGTMYEGGLRVPMIAVWANELAAGKTEDEPVITTDLLPTLFALTGAALPGGITLDGHDLAAVIDRNGVSATPTDGAEQTADRDLFWHYPHFSNQGGRPRSAIRSGNYKLLLSLEDGTVELYDLEADPAETNDLSGEQPERVAALRGKLVAWQQSVGAKLPPKKDGAMR